MHKNKNKRLTKKQPKPKLDIAFKEETKKNDIRKVNAYTYYNDGRIEKFMDLFNELFVNCMKYAKSKGNTWEYVYCKVLQVFGIEYIFKEEVKEENPDNKNNNATGEENKPKDEKKEEEKNNEEKKEEQENKEEEKNNEDEKEVILINNEDKNEEKNEGEALATESAIN